MLIIPGMDLWKILSLPPCQTGHRVRVETGLSKALLRSTDRFKYGRKTQPLQPGIDSVTLKLYCMAQSTLQQLYDCTEGGTIKRERERFITQWLSPSHIVACEIRVKAHWGTIFTTRPCASVTRGLHTNPPLPVPTLTSINYLIIEYWKITVE